MSIYFFIYIDHLCSLHLCLSISFLLSCQTRIIIFWRSIGVSWRVCAYRFVLREAEMFISWFFGMFLVWVNIPVDWLVSFHQPYCKQVYFLVVMCVKWDLWTTSFVTPYWFNLFVFFYTLVLLQLISPLYYTLALSLGMLFFGLYFYICVSTARSIYKLTLRVTICLNFWYSFLKQHTSRFLYFGRSSINLIWYHRPYGEYRFLLAGSPPIFGVIFLSLVYI